MLQIQNLLTIKAHKLKTENFDVIKNIADILPNVKWKFYNQ